MKRLKHYLLNMQNDTATYREMYEGAMCVVPPTAQAPWMEYDSTYWNGDISVTIEGTHKLAQDKPTLIMGYSA